MQSKYNNVGSKINNFNLLLKKNYSAARKGKSTS